MGLFSFVGGLLGGGGTNVQQQAANTSETNVDVSIQNVLDVGPIAAVLEWLGLKEAEQAQLDREAAAAQAVQGSKDAQSVIAAIEAANQVQVEQNQKIINAVAPWLKGMAVAAMGLMGVLILKNWKGVKI